MIEHKVLQSVYLVAEYYTLKEKRVVARIDKVFANYYIQLDTDEDLDSLISSREDLVRLVRKEEGTKKEQKAMLEKMLQCRTSDDYYKLLHKNEEFF